MWFDFFLNVLMIEFNNLVGVRAWLLLCSGTRPESNFASEWCAAHTFGVKHIDEVTLSFKVGPFVNTINDLLGYLALADRFISKLATRLSQDYSYDFVFSLVQYWNFGLVSPLVSILLIELSVPRLAVSLAIVIKRPMQRVSLWGFEAHSAEISEFHRDWRTNNLAQFLLRFWFFHRSGCDGRRSWRFLLHDASRSLRFNDSDFFRLFLWYNRGIIRLSTFE